MQTHEIRKRFLEHFVQAGHTEVPSTSVILDDPNLLFINAGMVQFVPFFLGQRTPPYSRATSIQKCIRTPDIDEVGKTTRHNTFFQMAGNFSFGDYFKHGAIELAWKLLTTSRDQGGYGMDPQKLWATVYRDDDEAAHLWQEIAGLPPERIQRRGMDDNYWSMGIPGPCGPSSEIYYDRGPDFGREGGPVANEDRYIEIWNLVFMQNNRGQGTTKTDYDILGPLPRKNIDTGMGIERVAFLLQGVHNVYETDLLRPIIDTVETYALRPYSVGNHADDIRYRVIADHCRTAAILIADGVVPGNDGRGYVLRRLLRRVMRAAKLLGITTEIMHPLMKTVSTSMGPSYPELIGDFDRINQVALVEEAAFARTLSAGSRLFDMAVANTRSLGKKQLSGRDAFTLHDTYGFPLELTLEMASEVGLSVDENHFHALMKEQKTRAKVDALARKHAHADMSRYRELLDRGPTEFTGFQELSSCATIIGIFVDDQQVPAIAYDQLHCDQRIELILDRSPLYAESGGQLADRGTIMLAGTSTCARVTDVQKIAKTLWVHRVDLQQGQFLVGDEVVVSVDPSWRQGATQAHSGTHLLHAALRTVLGPHAIQAGSLNRPGYIRFDFQWHGPLHADQQSQIELVVNEAVLAHYPVTTFMTDLEHAKAMGAMALFGEQYPEQVRVVEIGSEFSRELCGGTHVENSSQIGIISLVGESSVGSGVRRVEAYVGLEAFRHLTAEQALLHGLAATLKVPSHEVPQRVYSLVERLKNTEKELDKLRRDHLEAQVMDDILHSVHSFPHLRLVTAQLPRNLSGQDLRSIAKTIDHKLGSDPLVSVLVSVGENTVLYIITANQGANDQGYYAHELAKVFAQDIEGRGGGKPQQAQGSGKNIAGIESGFTRIRHYCDHHAVM